jgi:hypothetical protein
VKREDDYNCIAARRIQLIGQVNNVLSTFGKLNPNTKNSLLYKLCSSLYGSVNWNLLHHETNRVCTSWRLPPSAHSDTVSVLGSNRTLFDELCHRTLKFIMFILSNHNCNNSVNFIVRTSLFFCRSLSPLGRNFVYISQRYNFSPDLISNPNNCSTVMSYFTNFCTTQFEKVCTPFLLLVETLMLRNNLLNFDGAYESLSIAQMDDIIDLHCTQ